MSHDLHPMMKAVMITAACLLAGEAVVCAAVSETTSRLFAADACRCTDELHSHSETPAPVRALFNPTVLVTTNTSTATATGTR